MSSFGRVRETTASVFCGADHMLTICTFLWGQKYDESYVAKLARGLDRHLSQPCRVVCFTDNLRRLPDGVTQMQIPNMELLDVPGCFARLRLFDPALQERLGADRIVCVDLDAIITGPLDPLFDRPEPFAILQGANASNPCPYNGSLWMLRAGYRPDVWADFSLDAAAKVPFDKFPDDQAWFNHKMPDAAGWRAGAESGVYAFKKPGWPAGDELPKGARLVAFPGWRDPSLFTNLRWVKENWH